ncbi:unnamed protein product [Acanthoscelides obtectus]|uniref:Uncharacterized protein n=1 Tax=Acanthoscelides obtectus TaxID=200917 RepID=A0A9P0QBZ8_ACAOB|nr:unnamed protein product [Acanthoscelides obtectus]CAK1684710.1 hypothetical protein AOBTE_LOCUS35053 [Acanthoscelides obtectus]
MGDQEINVMLKKTNSKRNGKRYSKSSVWSSTDRRRLENCNGKKTNPKRDPTQYSNHQHDRRRLENYNMDALINFLKVSKTAMSGCWSTRPASLWNV